MSEVGLAAGSPYVVLKQSRRQPPKASCSVYLVANASGSIKIGMSGDPAKRLAGLRTSSAEKLTLEHSWRLAGRDQAERLEGALHRLFKPVRRAREWFGASVVEVRSVAAFLLTGEDAEAAELAAAIVAHRAVMTEWDEKNARHKGLHFRWGKDERAELAERLEELADLMVTTAEECLRLGLEPNEWDDVLSPEALAMARRPRA